MTGGFLNDQISPHAIWYGGLLIGMAATLGLYLLRGAQRREPALDPEAGEVIP